MARGKRPKHSTVKIEETPYRSSETQRRVCIKVNPTSEAPVKVNRISEAPIIAYPVGEEAVEEVPIKILDGRKTLKLAFSTIGIKSAEEKDARQSNDKNSYLIKLIKQFLSLKPKNR